jgi:hypothetical protein
MNTKTKNRGSKGNIGVGTLILIAFLGGVGVLYYQKYIMSGPDNLEAKCKEIFEADKKLVIGLPYVTDEFKASEIHAAVGRYNCCKKGLTVGYTWDFTVSACLPNKSGS